MSKENKSGSTASLHQQFGKDDLETDQVESNEASSAELLDHASYQELQKQLTEAEEKASQSWERLLRMQAETENMQRRVERDIADAHKYALKKFTMELLPVVDSLERALAFHIENQAEASMLDGVSLTLKMLLSAMEKFGSSYTGDLRHPSRHRFFLALTYKF